MTPPVPAPGARRGLRLPLRTLAPGLALLFASHLATSLAHALTLAPDEPARRTVRVFTFDEPDNPESIPDGWLRAQDRRDAAAPGSPSTLGGVSTRPGFPEFNRAEFDFQVAHSGNASVRLPTMGGSTSLRLQAGELPVFPDADYVVSAWVRTTDLRHARAVLVVRLLDQRLEPISGSELRSQPLLSVNDWTPVSITMPGRFRDAAWLQIDLELLQPQQLEPAPTGPAAQHKVWRQDVNGSAWFDDVAVHQVPRARLYTDSLDNLIVRGKPTTLWVTVRDLAGKPLRGRLSITDAYGVRVAVEERGVDPGARPTPWSPTLPGLGWYNAELEVWSDTDVVSRTQLWLGHIPASSASSAPLGVDRERERFGIIVDTASEPDMHLLPGIIDHLGTGFVYIPALDPAAPASDSRQTMTNRAEMYRSLLDRGQQITLTLSRIPAALAARLALDDDDAVGMLTREPDGWRPFLEPTLDVYGQRLRRYQLGPVGDRHAVRRSLDAPLASFKSGLSRLVPSPLISLSWPGQVDPPALWSAPPSSDPVANAVTLIAPASFTSDGVRELCQRWRDAAAKAGAAPVELTIVPELPDLELFGAASRVTELVRRAVEFWSALGDAPPGTPPARLGVQSAMRFVQDTDTASADAQRRAWPAPELVALRTLAERLGGRRVVAKLPAPPGVKAYVLAGRTAQTGVYERGCVVAWTESAAADGPAQSFVEVAPAQPSVTIVDPFGNERVLAVPAPAPPPASHQASEKSPVAGAAPLLPVPVSDMPVFIEGVDPYLALFVAAFRVEPSYLRAVVAEHELKIVMSNPWPIRVTGKLQLRSPDDDSPKRARAEEWTLTPRGIIDFALAPGETIEIPLTMSMGAGIIAGKKDFISVAKITADRTYPPLRIKAPIEIGLPNIDLVPELFLGPGPDGPDAIVNVSVTNRDTKSRTLRLEAAARNQPTQQQQLSDLQPGQTTLRRFVLRGAAKELSGRRILLSLSDTEGAERLNKSVLVP